MMMDIFAIKKAAGLILSGVFLWSGIDISCCAKEPDPSHGSDSGTYVERSPLYMDLKPRSETPLKGKDATKASIDLLDIGKYAPVGAYLPSALEDCPVAYAKSGTELVVNLMGGGVKSGGAMSDVWPCVYSVDPKTKKCTQKAVKLNRNKKLAYAIARGMDEAGKIIIGSQAKPESTNTFAEVCEGGCWNAETGDWHALTQPDLSRSPATDPEVAYVPIRISANGEYIVGKAFTLEKSDGDAFGPSWKKSMKNVGFDLSHPDSEIKYRTADEAPQSGWSCFRQPKAGWYFERTGASPKRLSSKNQKKIIKDYRKCQRSEGRLLLAGSRPSYVLWKKTSDYQYKVEKVFLNFSYQGDDFQFDYFIDLGEKGDVLFAVAGKGAVDRPLFVAAGDTSGNYQPNIDMDLPLRLHRTGSDGSVDGYIAINKSEGKTQLVINGGNDSHEVKDYSTNMPVLYSGGWNPYMPVRCPKDNSVEVFYAAISIFITDAILPGYIVVTDPESQQKTYEKAYDWLISKDANKSDQKNYKYPAYFYGGELSGDNVLNLHGQIESLMQGILIATIDASVTGWVTQSGEGMLKP